MPATDRNATTVEGHLQTRIPQAPRLHQEFAHTLQVVIIVKRTRPTHAWAQGILCSRALALPDDLWRDDDCRRCQIECHVRDAQQDWGLEDFLNVTATAVTHAAHLALCMVHGSHRRLRDLRPSAPASGILGLKAPCRGDTYVRETITRLPETPAAVLVTKIFAKVTCVGRMHAVQPSFSPG